MFIKLLVGGGGGGGFSVLGLAHFENVLTHGIETAAVPFRCRNFVGCCGVICVSRSMQWGIRKFEDCFPCFKINNRAGWSRKDFAIGC